MIFLALFRHSSGRLLPRTLAMKDHDLERGTAGCKTTPTFFVAVAAMWDLISDFDFVQRVMELGIRGLVLLTVASSKD